LDRDLVSAGTLYVVATPLGNLGDLSDRAKGVLRAVGTVAAEDTRRARVLLQHVDARPKVLSYHAHSPPSRVHKLIEVLERGDDVALLSDAGTPAISDPGPELVEQARAAGAQVVAVPGPSAVAAALSIAGVPANRYTFLGFLPRKGAERRRLLEHAAASPWTSVIFESPTRLVALLQGLADTCGTERAAAVARELTKRHEELQSGTLAFLAGYYEENPPRGEVTILVTGREPARPEVDEHAVGERARALLDEGMTRRDAAQRLAAEFAMSRRDAYRIVTGL
jgi:16S rRNA (cytidine1402-2'-O)-methyltransferase